jgi:uncharacterized membrane protein
MGFTRTIASAALAATATYFFDPVSGRRRRARAREKVASTVNELQSAAGTAARDLAHRGQGMVARTRAAMRSDTWADDDVIVERVRSAIGRVISHPGAIEVRVHEGHALVSGAILADERQGLIDTVRSVRGVQGVQDYLSGYESAEGVPSLQGGDSLEGQPESQKRWPPGAQLLFGVLGGALVLVGIRSRGVMGFLEVGGGTALLTRSLVNRPLSEITGRPRHGRIIVGKDLVVKAPVEKVFRALANYTNFPQFMRNVREVKQDSSGRSHWVVAGPAGVPVEWDSITTRYEPDRVISWCSLPGSTVDHAGTIRLEPTDDGGTYLEVKMSYAPPAGALGHVVAQLFGADPKTEMDEDLLRLKSFLETGTRPQDAGATAQGEERTQRKQAGQQRQAGGQPEQSPPSDPRPH